MNFFERIFAFHVMLNKTLHPSTQTPALAASLGMSACAMWNFQFFLCLLALWARDRSLMMPYDRLSFFLIAFGIYAVFWIFYERPGRSTKLLHRIARFSKEERRSIWWFGGIYVVLSWLSFPVAAYLVVIYTP